MDQVLNELNECRREVGEAYARRDYGAVVELFNTWVSKRAIYDTLLFNLAVSALELLGRGDLALSLIGLMEQRGDINLQNVDFCVRCFGQAGAPGEGTALLERMLHTASDESQIRSIRYRLFSALKKAGDAPAARSVLSKLSFDSEFSDLRPSFVVPILDDSPGTPGYNYKRLFSDLEKVPGDLIAIVNNPELMDEVKSHPRVNSYALLSDNFGVPRAWNIGLQLCRTKYCFFLNADLTVTEGCIRDLVQALEQHPGAALAGPQGVINEGVGGFLNESKVLWEGTFDSVTECDVVMGSIFGVNARTFQRHSIAFDTNLTPAFSEEADTAFQLRRHGYSVIAVPTTGFAHGGSGSHITRATINFCGTSIDKFDLILRNRAFVDKKWNVLTKE